MEAVRSYELPSQAEVDTLLREIRRLLPQAVSECLQAKARAATSVIGNEAVAVLLIVSDDAEAVASLALELLSAHFGATVNSSHRIVENTEDDVPGNN